LNFNLFTIKDFEFIISIGSYFFQ